jgi:probable HAF family extracellular repeat protein
MTDLGILPGHDSSVASQVSDSGQVIGYSSIQNQFSRAFSWTAAQGMVDLGALPGDRFSVALAVNTGGQVVGYSFSANADPTDLHGFVWTSAGGMVPLGSLDGHSNRSIPSGINASAQVIGISPPVDSEGRAFVWTPSGGMVSLGTLGGRISAALGMSANGQVVGFSSLVGESVLRAFSWTTADGMVPLDTLGGGRTYAVAVNANGQIVGQSETASGRFRAVLWSRGGAMRDLGTLAGDSDTFAYAVNARGLVVGVSNGSGPASHAFIWTAAGGMRPLAALGGEHSVPFAVNDRGTIVGVSESPIGPVHATLWQLDERTVTPVADTYVRAGAYADRNFGSSRELRAKLGTASSLTRRGYLKFDISSVTDVDTVTLRLYGHVSSIGTRRVRTSIYPVADTSWEEHTMTWNSKPGYGGVLGTVTVAGVAPQWVELDVTSYIQSARRDGRQTVSFALRTPLHTSAYASFNSREAADRAPELAVIAEAGRSAVK